MRHRTSVFTSHLVQPIVFLPLDLGSVGTAGSALHPSSLKETHQATHEELSQDKLVRAAPTGDP